jgi:putative thiamine transport system permease protein
MGSFARSRLVKALRSGLMQAVRRYLGAAPLVLLFLLPLALSLILLLPGLVDIQAFQALFQHPQFSGALKLTLFTGLASTALSLTLAVLITSQIHRNILQQASVFLSVPHLALAMGLGFLIAPTGLLARLIAVLITDWASPPQWQTTQDPYGLALIAALVLKETPFLVWAIASVMQQDELKQRFARETIVARSLGHGPHTSFMRIVLPQVLQRSLWPLIAVFSYGMTVVDMALIIGPTQPPTLAQLVWTDLNDGEVMTNARGAAGTLMLSGLIILVLTALLLMQRATRPLQRHWMTQAARPETRSIGPSKLILPIWTVIYGLVIVALALQSFSALWPFPDVVAPHLTITAWARLLQDASPFWTSVVIAIVSSCLSLIAVVTWLETQSQARDRIALAAATAMLCLPALLVALGQYRLLLLIDGTGTWGGLLFAHVLSVTAYVLVMLTGPYRAFDPRWRSASHGLSASRFAFLSKIKWPMLTAPLLSSLAIGFAVSIAQFVPAQLAAAGRLSTLPMEAITLSSGGNRALIAVYALVLMALPLIAFQLSSWASRPRWRTA